MNVIVFLLIAGAASARHVLDGQFNTRDINGDVVIPGRKIGYISQNPESTPYVNSDFRQPDKPIRIKTNERLVQSAVKYNEDNNEDSLNNISSDENDYRLRTNAYTTEEYSTTEYIVQNDHVYTNIKDQNYIADRNPVNQGAIAGQGYHQRTHNAGFIKSNDPISRPENKPAIERPENRPAVERPENRPAIERPENRPAVERPENRPAIERPENRPAIERPENRPAVERPENQERRLETSILVQNPQNERTNNIANRPNKPVSILETVLILPMPSEDTRPGIDRLPKTDTDEQIWVWGTERNNVTSIEPDSLGDRAAFSGDQCPTGKAKVKGICVEKH